MATQIWAHRGASSKAPENTMEAFEQTVREGADGIELDVHLSADGIPVVIHDSTLERVSGEIGLVHDRTLAQLKRLDVSNPIPGYGIARIPALAGSLRAYKSNWFNHKRGSQKWSYHISRL